jgi:hypothetical protein
MPGGEREFEAVPFCVAQSVLDYESTLGWYFSRSFVTEVIEQSGKQHRVNFDPELSNPSPGEVRIGRQVVEIKVHGGCWSL